MKATYAGHSAVLFDVDGFAVAVDPWLKGNPLCPDHLADPARLDLIVLTHGHADHASDAVRLQQATGAVVAATYELAMILIGEGVPADRVQPMNKGGTIAVGPVRVTLTHAFHSSSFDSPTRGTLYAGEACGVVLHGGGKTAFHAGDTALFQELEQIGGRYRPDVSFLPIGDRFTMGPEEAAEAARLVGAPLAVPIHYKTFPLLVQTATAFASGCALEGIHARELQPGETLDLRS